MCEAGISASSTAAASDHENPEQTHERSNSPGPEDSRSLPSIRHERRKAGRAEWLSGRARWRVKRKTDRTMGWRLGSEPMSKVEEEVLPPIGGLKGKRDSKMKTQTFKTAANVRDLSASTAFMS